MLVIDNYHQYLAKVMTMVLYNTFKICIVQNPIKEYDVYLYHFLDSNQTSHIALIHIWITINLLMRYNKLSNCNDGWKRVVIILILTVKK